MAHQGSAAAAAGETVDRAPRQAPFGAPHAFVLLVIDGDDACMTHRIVRSETVLGRGDEAQFVIKDDQISKAHCRIRVEGGVCSIVDLGSRNGTVVNGRRLAPDVALRLRNLDEIEVGNHRLFLLAGKFRSQSKQSAT